MTFLDGGKAEKAFSSETGLGLANNRPLRQAAHFFFKKMLVFRANRPISALAHFRTCLWSCVGLAGIRTRGRLTAC